MPTPDLTRDIIAFMDSLPWFHGASWATWRSILRVLFALPMDEADLEAFQRLTGRATPPAEQVGEAWLLLGRRSGKTVVSALVAVFLATLRDYTGILAPGEQGVVMCIAPDRRQGRVLLRYIMGMLDRVPALACLVVRRTQDAVHLSNGIVIEVHTASYRALRGYTVIAGIVDEVCFLRDETSANPDVEILNALRPAMSTVPGALLLCISSPYSRRGAAWEAWRAHWGHDGDPVLVVNADTRTMNPTVPEATIRAAYEADEVVAAAEYGAEFRRDIDAFVSREAVEACVVAERRELAPVRGMRYVAFTDMSGAGADSFTLAVAHREGEDAVLDLVREVRPPLSPEAVIADFAATLADYGVATVTGDRYAGEFPREHFRKRGITYALADRPKSDLYRDVLPAINSGRVQLLDNARLVAQWCGLERRTARSGKDSIDHGPRGHDDVANAVAGALLLALSAKPRVRAVWGSTLPELAAGEAPVRGITWGSPARPAPAEVDGETLTYERDPASGKMVRRLIPHNPDTVGRRLWGHDRADEVLRRLGQ